MATYSFMDVNASIIGPGGAFALGYSSGSAEEGITVEQTEDKDTMLIGADGAVMHSLHAGKSGTVTVRLLKTSPTNQMLSAMYDLQTVSSSLHGSNIIVISDTSRGDVITCREAAFRRMPTVTYAKEGGVMEWAFNVGKIDSLLGKGAGA